jgi:DNA-binding transcriptional LysR family regulator
MSAMDLKHLQNLVYLAEELHFGRAAERAHLSQSAFTRSIQALEAEAGLLMFDRDRRHVRITPAGRRAAERARALLSEARELGRELDFIRTGDMGQVAVTAGPFSARFLVMPVIRELHLRHPRVSARLEVSDGTVGMEHLMAETVDLVVGDLRNLPYSTGITVHPLGRFHTAFFCRAGHPLAGRRGPLEPAELRGYSFACVTMVASMVARLAALLELGPRDPFPVAFECSSLPALTDMALETDMILMNSPVLVQDLIGSGRLVPIEVARVDPRRDLVASYGVARLAGRTLTPAGELLFRRIVEAGQVILDTEGWMATPYQPAVE